MHAVAAAAAAVWVQAAAPLLVCERKCAAAGHCCTGATSSHDHPSCAIGCLFGGADIDVSGVDRSTTPERCRELCDAAESAHCDFAGFNSDSAPKGVHMCGVCGGECDSSAGVSECYEGCGFAFGAPMPTPAPPTPAPTYTPGWEARIRRVRCETTQGRIDIDVHPEWAPIGAEYFLELVREGYWDDVGFIRVNGNIIQFGEKQLVAGERQRSLRDDPKPPRQTSNRMMLRRGELSYAGGGPNTRGSSIFFVTKPDRYLGKELWEVPFAEIVPPGMDVVDRLYSGYGDLEYFKCRTCHGPDVQRVFREGNEYLKSNFPKLDYMLKCEVLSAQTPQPPPPPTPPPAPLPTQSVSDLTLPADSASSLPLVCVSVGAVLAVWWWRRRSRKRGVKADE